jgi:c-di-GMP-binding flagellar brake protein YcgR
MIMGSTGTAKIQERRQTSRFPVREDLTYKVLHSKRESITGSGTTLNISSEGILFTTQEALPLGRTVELSVNWPARLDGTCALKFVALGRVVRSEANQAVARIERYEFKTRGNAPKLSIARAIASKLQEDRARV